MAHHKKTALGREYVSLASTIAFPELNPTEQVWQVLRDRYLENHYFKSYDPILECCGETWNAFTSRANAIRELF